jgi:branched-chain amino acid transport system substrate-binding protein
LPGQYIEHTLANAQLAKLEVGMSRLRILLPLAWLVASSLPADAQYQGGPIKIGVLNDQSGLYSDIAGPGSVWAAKKAVEDFGAATKGMKV